MRDWYLKPITAIDVMGSKIRIMCVGTACYSGFRSRATTK